MRKEFEIGDVGLFLDCTAVNEAVGNSGLPGPYQVPPSVSHKAWKVKSWVHTFELPIGRTQGGMGSLGALRLVPV